MGIDHTQLSESELVDLIVREPRLLRRPFMVVNGKPLFGFKAEKFSEAFKK
ncbi:MAG: hypothetical protein HY327_09840 [Chloroflexi bacterium]|nr:hypothetical protein [Chloroflexota bacterium]